MRKKFRYLSLIIIVFLSFSFIASPVTSDGAHVSASGAILIDNSTGRVLYSLNPHSRLPMASTTKIMTALIAIEYGKLDEVVKIKKSCVGIEGSSIYLYNGEEITLRDIVYGLMLRSGNDAAVAIAIHISGSVSNFAELMNKKAKEIGALNTNFKNPHGLHEKDHYTTAYDLALITREAMKHNEFREISKTKVWKADRETNNYFYNKNKTLWQYEGGDGVKIGYTQVAGRCLVSSATRNGIQLIAVVLNDNNWFNDCYNLFDYGFENYKPTVIYSRSQYIKMIQVINGNEENIELITKNDLILPLKEEDKDKLKIHIDTPQKISAPIIKGQEVGNIKIYLEGQLVSCDKLIARDSVEEKNILDRVKGFISNMFS
ncbi:D-alanyl-D-alanine carboxypeptidase (penicillin-binding protein 5/6) [Brassicibacter mesophilus]